MVRIKIEDLPVLEEMTQEEMANIVGGIVLGDLSVDPNSNPNPLGDINR
jgi:bacteriocin-like protein